MNYEEKYKEALERARESYRRSIEQGWACDKEIYEQIFPELRESEDERIRKELIEFIRHGNCVFDSLEQKNRFWAWLKKQGEKEPIEQDTEIRDLWEYIQEWREKFGRIPKDEDELADCIFYVMKRQKPADKIEPKFKVGDWITNGEYTWFIEGTHNSFYDIISPEGCGTDDTITHVDDNFHIWTIQDAKDGDVLSSGNPFIFRGFGDKRHPNCPTAYCGINSLGTFTLSGENDWWTANDVHSATKEQRDILFKKMKEAGYEWDAEKKELKKIEQSCNNSDGLYYAIDILEKTLGKVEGYQSDDGKMEHQIAIETVNALYHKKPAEWSEEDERTYSEILDFFLGDIETRCATIDKQRHFGYWLKSIKDRVQPQPKQEWSKEDEKMLNEIIDLLTPYGKCPDYPSPEDQKYYYTRQKMIDWLKSLKPHWKPSEEQMEALETAIRCRTMPWEQLGTLYNEIKKL